MIDSTQSAKSNIYAATTPNIEAAGEARSEQVLEKDTSYTSELVKAFQGEGENADQIRDTATLLHNLGEMVRQLFENFLKALAPSTPGDGNDQDTGPGDTDGNGITPPDGGEGGGNVDPDPVPPPGDDGDTGGDTKEPDPNPPGLPGGPKPPQTSGRKHPMDGPTKSLKKTGQFVWKPKSSKNGDLAIILPSYISKNALKVSLIGKDGKKILHHGKFAGMNGSRAQFRFSRSGEQYQDNITVAITMKDGTVYTMPIKDSSKPLEF